MILSFSRDDYLDIFTRSMKGKGIVIDDQYCEPGDLVLWYNFGIYLTEPNYKPRTPKAMSFEYLGDTGPEDWHEYLGWNEGRTILDRSLVLEAMLRVDERFNRIYIKVLREDDEFDFTTITDEEYSTLCLMGLSKLPPKSWKGYA